MFQHTDEFVDHLGDRRVELLKDLRDCAAVLLQQSQEDVFGVDLGMFVLLQQFVGAHGGFLCFFGKSVKSHHGNLFLLDE